MASRPCPPRPSSNLSSPARPTLVARGATSRMLVSVTAIALVLSALASPSAVSADGLSVDQMNQMRRVTSVAVSPDGSQVAYLVDVPRRPGVDEDGPSRVELHLVAAGEKDPRPRPFVTGDVRVSSPTFSPDGRYVLYTARRGDDEESALWAIPVDGGESRKVLEHPEGIGNFELSPDGKQVVVVMEEPIAESREEAEEEGYDRDVFEEEWRPNQVWLFELAPFAPEARDPAVGPSDAAEPRLLEVEGSASSVAWSADGARLAISVQPRNLVDDNLMYQRIHVHDVESGDHLVKLANPGKLGDFALSPDGRHVALVSAADWNDPSPGRLLVTAVDGGGAGELRDLMPEYEAHVGSIAWRDASTLVWSADERSGTTLGTVDLEGRVERLAQSSPERGVPIVGSFDLADTGRLAYSGQDPTHPGEVFVHDPGKGPRRLTNSNPWLADVELAKQEIITWTASDGLELEGILIHPLDGARPAPLILMVHGGPEANDSHGWLTGYSRPGQVAAARGYAVLYPNYRGSTGRGVAFSKTSQGDAAGKEFQDLVEAVDHLVEVGIADRDRVGITGGSYGGYATAWCSTYYTDRFAAGSMFVGISNKASKGFTTDIPIEDQAVHTLFPPWTKWQFGLERSPLYHASKSKTPLLIAGGTADTRVHPSQSLQLYRALKLQDKTVRYVRYPGEPHGNRRAASRDDYSRRLLRWMDHFVRDGKKELPPVEIETALASSSDEADDESEPEEAGDERADS